MTFQNNEWFWAVPWDSLYPDFPVQSKAGSQLSHIRHHTTPQDTGAGILPHQRDALLVQPVYQEGTVIRRVCEPYALVPAELAHALVICNLMMKVNSSSHHWRNQRHNNFYGTENTMSQPCLWAWGLMAVAPCRWIRVLQNSTAQINEFPQGQFGARWHRYTSFAHNGAKCNTLPVSQITYMWLPFRMFSVHPPLM